MPNQNRTPKWVRLWTMVIVTWEHWLTCYGSCQMYNCAQEYCRSFGEEGGTEYLEGCDAHEMAEDMDFTLANGGNIAIYTQEQLDKVLSDPIAVLFQQEELVTQ